MKKLIFIALLVITGYSTSYSQTKRIDYYSAEVMDEIKATEAQKEAVKELSAKYRVLFNRAKAKSLSEEESKTEMKRLIGERAKEYWKILTPEQTKYLKDKAKDN